jgi:hypothetical protein
MMLPFEPVTAVLITPAVAAALLAVLPATASPPASSCWRRC